MTHARRLTGPAASLLSPVLFLLTLSLAACGGSGKKRNQPCDVGVNASACALDVRQTSSWGETFSTYESDPQTNQKKPETERVINLNYDFAPGTPARWRRTITVDGSRERLTMFQEGSVRSIVPGILTLAIESSSCDDDVAPAAQVETIYYRRLGGSLEIDTQPVAPPTKSKFFLDGLMADVMTKAIGTALRHAMESAFTFGSVRTYLTSNHATMSARAVDVSALANAKSVCFNGLGSGYAESKQRPGW